MCYDLPMVIPTSRAELIKALVTNPVGASALLWSQVPLAGFAGLKVLRLDERGAEVLLPAGWRTQNPFQSTYFAAQAMAAELSTGATALYYIGRTGENVASLVTELTAKFTKKATRDAVFTFDDGAGLKAAIDEAARGGEARTFTCRSVGRESDGKVVAEFEITWSFKRRAKKHRA